MTPAALQALVDQRARLVTQAGQIVDRARSSNRGMNAEERQNYDRYHNDAADLKTQIDALTQSRGCIAGPGRTGGTSHTGAAVRQTTVMTAEDSLRNIRASEEYRSDFTAYLETGRVSADLQADQGEKGGYMVPTEFANEIVKTLDNIFWFRQKANVLPRTKAESVQFPRRTGRMSMSWGAELTTPTKDTGVAFGQLTLSPGWMCGEIDVSNSLLASGIVDVDGFVMEEISYAGMELEENAFMTGDGIRKPLGLFTPHNDGVPTSRDVVGTVSTDSLYEVKFSLREVYLRSQSISWMAGREFIKSVAKLKDTNNNPLWVVSVRAGEPDTLLGVPTTVTEYAPAGTGINGAFASGDYAAVLGDLRNYDVLDGLDMSVQRLVELEARRNLTCYLVRRKVDGRARHAEAFARLKTAA